MDQSQGTISKWFNLVVKQEWIKDPTPEITLQQYLAEHGIKKKFYITFALFALLLELLLILTTWWGLIYSSVPLVLILFEIFFFLLVLRIINTKRIHLALYIILFPLLILLLSVPVSHYVCSYAKLFLLNIPHFSSGMTYLTTCVIALVVGYWIASLYRGITDDRGLIIAGVVFSSIYCFVLFLTSYFWFMLEIAEQMGYFHESVANIHVLFYLSFVAFNIHFVRKSKWINLYLIPFAIYLLVYLISVSLARSKILLIMQ